MSLRFYLRYLLRDSRGDWGRLAFFGLCLGVGVAAVVAVAAVTDGLDAAIRREAKRLLGADLAVVAHRPLPAAAVHRLESIPGARIVKVAELASMALAADAGTAPRAPGTDASLLIEVKAVDPGYPLYGKLGTAPQRPLEELLGDRGAVAEPELLRRLRLSLGDRLRVGETEVTLTATLTAEPDRVFSAVELGPRLLVSRDTLAASRLETFGSRITHRTLVRLPGNPDRRTVEILVGELRRSLVSDPGVRVEGFQEGRPSLRRSLDRLGRFAGLVALVSLIVGGVGVAQAVRAFLAERLDDLALLKCLGLRPRQAFSLYLGQALSLAVAGSLAGAAGGLTVQGVAPLYLSDVLAVPVQWWQPRAVGWGLALGVATGLLFTLPPLARVLAVPPLRALRREVEPLPPRRWATALTGAALMAGITALAAAQARSLTLGLRFAGGLTAAVLGLAAVAWLLRRGAAVLYRGPGPLWLRHGAAALDRPAADTLPAVVALGVGLLVVVGAALVQAHLTDALDTELPADAPDAFFIDIQPDQWPEVRSILAAAGAGEVRSVPVVMARLAAIDGRPVAELAAGADRQRRWALTREQRLTYLERLPPGNTLLEGRWWSGPTPGEVSVEEGFAEELGIGVGSRLTFDVQGVPMELRVTSIRKVEWRSFAINFFLVVRPGVLDDAPQLRVATARFPASATGILRDRLASRLPNVTVLELRPILEQIGHLFGRLGLAVRFLGGFAVVAGAAILFGAVSARAVPRAREVALLKALGFRRREVAAQLATELALTGGVAGVAAAVGGVVLSWAVVDRGFELPWHPYPGILATAVIAATLLAVAAGLAASRSALRRPPAQVLRGE